jgi:hypothetical protein
MKRPPGRDLLPVTDHIRANAAGIQLLAHLQANADPRERDRCLLGPAWLCPFALQGEAWPCQRQDAASLNLCADLFQITYTCKTERITGQLHLFDPNWRRVCRHHQTGAILHDPKPQHVLRVCQARSAAFIAWFEHDQGWQPAAWKILPVTGNAAARMEWAWQMQARHQHLKPCIFEDL